MTSPTRQPPRTPIREAELASQLLAGSRLFTSVRVLERTGSTNADLLAEARAGAPAGAVLVAEEQTAGRGRLARSWHSEPGAALLFSVLLRPAAVTPSRRSWLPLLTGVAMVSALRAAAGLQASLKWPNDVLAGGGTPGDSRKLAGILAEQAGDAIVVGVGLNVTASHAELPSPQATSLWLEGAPHLDREAILLAALRELEQWYLRWCDTSPPGDADAAGLRAGYLRYCVTVGQDVRVELPAGNVLTGRAADVDSAGRLLVSADGDVHAVSAGDVVHVRPPR
ncbi:MAG TPA: biotin--[acetyl-CoA-carboxylase] ligase [Streptosporangiaceae bacterium]|nr:biotin--[acetyl-CoA-carboxylase] ligase [Streptosporangiaceae bacterium]